MGNEGDGEGDEGDPGEDEAEFICASFRSMALILSFVLAFLSAPALSMENVEDRLGSSVRFRPCSLSVLGGAFNKIG